MCDFVNKRQKKNCNSPEMKRLKKIKIETRKAEKRARQEAHFLSRNQKKEVRRQREALMLSTT